MKQLPRDVRPLTFFVAVVEVLDVVVQADPDGGEADLPLQPGDQPVVQGLGAFCLHHGRHGAKHPPVADVLSCLHFLLTLNLGSKINTFVSHLNAALTRSFIQFGCVINQSSTVSR